MIKRRINNCLGLLVALVLVLIIVAAIALLIWILAGLAGFPNDVGSVGRLWL